MILHPIHHTFAPHVDAAYAWETLKLLFQPSKWQKGEETDELRSALAAHFQADVTLFASGREALLALLQSLHIGKGDEIIIQSYTCVVVPNAITATGATPVYADIDQDTLNLTPETVERVISNRTKVVICQHTFGIPTDTERLRDLCDQYEIPLIEDCAHIIPDTKGPKEIGRYGDYLILSFGRDKAISGIAGGALISRKPIPLPTTHPLLPTPYIARLLLYPLLYFLARPLYGIGIGKLLLWLAAKIGLIIPIVTKMEKEGHMNHSLHTIPNACAALAFTQFQKLQQINDHRRMLTKFYLQACKDRGWKTLEGIIEDLPLQKFPIFITSRTECHPELVEGRHPVPWFDGLTMTHGILSKADHLRSFLKHQNIHLSDGWTGCTICPPSAEGIAAIILSLPTHPTMTAKQAHILIDTLNALL